VSSIQQMHTYLDSSEGQQGTNNSTRRLQRVLPELIVLKRNTKSQAIIEAVPLKYHVSVRNTYKPTTGTLYPSILLS